MHAFIFSKLTVLKDSFRNTISDPGQAYILSGLNWFQADSYIAKKECFIFLFSRYFYVRADKVMRLRHLLDKLGNISGMMNEEKDPEEFLNLLLNEIMRAEPFLHIR